MATKRIQDLENVEEVLADSLIPVGEATKTKSMLVSQLQKWLASFFVGKTGNETISGQKTFTDNITAPNVANTDLSNITAEAKDLIVGLGMPSDRYIEIDVTGNGMKHTAPANGYYNYSIRPTSTADGSFGIINLTKQSFGTRISRGVSGITMNLFTKAEKDDEVEVSYSGSSKPTLRFVYAEGSKE